MQREEFSYLSEEAFSSLTEFYLLNYYFGEELKIIKIYGTNARFIEGYLIKNLGELKVGTYCSFIINGDSVYSMSNILLFRFIYELPKLVLLEQHELNTHSLKSNYKLYDKRIVKLLVPSIIKINNIGNNIDTYSDGDKDVYSGICKVDIGEFKKGQEVSLNTKLIYIILIDDIVRKKLNFYHLFPVEPLVIEEKSKLS